MNGGKEPNTESDSDQSNNPRNSSVSHTSKAETSNAIDICNGIINNISSFMTGLESQKQSPWKSHWNIFEQRDGICFYRLSRDKHFKNVTMSFKILVNNLMKMTMYKNEVEADHSELNWILKHSQLEHWSQFYRLMEYYQQEPQIKLRSDPVASYRSIAPTRHDLPYRKYVDKTVSFDGHGASAPLYHGEATRRKRTRRSKNERMRLKQNLIDQNGRE